MVIYHKNKIVFISLHSNSYVEHRDLMPTARSKQRAEEFARFILFISLIHNINIYIVRLLLFRTMWVCAELNGSNLSRRSNQEELSHQKKHRKCRKKMPICADVGLLFLFKFSIRWSRTHACPTHTHVLLYRRRRTHSSTLKFSIQKKWINSREEDGDEAKQKKKRFPFRGH